jgi:hypothetical protein
MKEALLCPEMLKAVQAIGLGTDGIKIAQQKKLAKQNPVFLKTITAMPCRWKL